MAEKVLTWQEKVKQGIPLSSLDQVKADGWFIQTRRMREQKEEEERASLRAQTNSAKDAHLLAMLEEDGGQELSNQLEKSASQGRGRKPKEESQE